MRKTQKVFAVILGILALLLVFAIAILPFVVDPNQFKPLITEAIREKTGREVEFAGDLQLSVFPSTGLLIERIRIKNVRVFPETDFLSIEQSEVRVKLLPLLLQKRIEIDRIDLQGLRLHLIRTEAGLNNWSFERSKSSANAAVPSAPPAATAPPQEDAGLQLFAIGGASLKDSEIVWDDRQAGRCLEIDGINLDVGAFKWDQFTEVALKFSILEPESGYQDRIALHSRAMLKQNPVAANLAGAELILTREAKTQPGKALAAKLTAPEIIFEKDAQKLQASNLHFESAGVLIESSLSGANLWSDPDIQAGIEVAELNPREVLPRFGIAVPKFQDALAFTRLQADFNLRAAKDTLAIGAFRCRLDDTLLQGEAHLEDWKAPSIRFNLTGDAVDVGRYLPPSEKKNKLVSPSAAIAAALAKLPAERMRKLDAQGELHLRHLKVNGIAADDLHLQLGAREGVIQTRQGIGRFYGGRYSGGVDLNAKGGDTAVALTEKIDRVDIEAILKLIGSKIGMSGALTGSATLQGQGRDLKQIRHGLNGKLAFGVKDGAIRDVKFLKVINQGIGLLNQAPLPAGYGDGLKFSEISGSGSLAESILRSDDLLVKAPLFRITGSGFTNVDTGLADYRFVTHLVKAQATDTEPEKFHSTPIVVDMSGTLEDPRYRLDMKALLTEKNKAKIEKFLDKNTDKIDKLKDKLDKKLGPGVGDLLDRLF
ncbi:AsmA family protein [Methylomicrobium sp. RS1]|jgi:AsmA protein|uniref:AsmA family protein n=1 Tax=Candidatus Methylomicrobium oryzae TaxID=2802053 RepID=UPI001924F5B2|nr:AsmA family protein [Methylomicrobium sp. RS1]MBL1263382.1 AsmA family protein [Methylomicrobium sp. RS1]